MQLNIEQAYMQAMFNADWAGPESFHTMWDDASAADLMAIAQYLTARAQCLPTVSRPSPECLRDGTKRR